MPKTLRFVMRCYRALLWLYPLEFRAAYAREMTDVFEQQLRAEWIARGLRGTLVTGWYAIDDLFTVALPSRLLNQSLIAPCLAPLIAAAVFLSLTTLLQDRALAKWINHTFLFGG
jgi:hypothetical protein